MSLTVADAADAGAAFGVGRAGGDIGRGQRTQSAPLITQRPRCRGWPLGTNAEGAPRVRVRLLRRFPQGRPGGQRAAARAGGTPERLEGRRVLEGRLLPRGYSQ